MVPVNDILKINCLKSESYLIEKFVEELSKNLFINETYFGNLLTSLTLFFNYVVEKNQCRKLNINYITNYKILTINIEGVKKDAASKLLNQIELKDTENNEEENNIFLIQSLTDKIKYKNGKLKLVYDISALHDQIFNERKKLIKDFFSKKQNKEPAKNS